MIGDTVHLGSDPATLGLTPLLVPDTAQRCQAPLFRTAGSHA